ncbi:hypothetical protein [Desulfobacter postgatei]|uniref:Uncharacterized protein n=1 Tax=Desulfobacter postgatei 2ac9 TaxID=879212 RepID=I5B7M1_9BACT|nr:hypothetical protein [Desulfobacter postgatei]EIM65484.1 hypothetical protein DespoDRAFT_03749 [Desulfobacter postgatei 2ac9]
MKPIKCEFKTITPIKCFFTTFVPVPVRYEFEPLHQPAAETRKQTTAGLNAAGP